MKHILDNPIYNALISAHSIFSQGTDNVKYYPEEIGPFVGLKDNSEQDFEDFYQNSPTDRTFIVFTPDKVNIPDKWKLAAQIDMFQMVYDHKEFSEEESSGLVDLDESHVPQMIELVKLTQPGPFFSKTINLGNYTGVFDGPELVAMAGHRLNPAPYIEVSAVCTHPNHAGKGYGFRLIREQIKRILLKSATPFLHVRNDNHGAVKLYQKLGFHIRTEMMAYVLKKDK